jgi:hypothetical protein
MAEDRRKKLTALGAESRSSKIFFVCVYDIGGCQIRQRHLGLKNQTELQKNLGVFDKRAHSRCKMPERMPAERAGIRWDFKILTL